MANITAVLEAQRSLETALFAKMEQFDSKLKVATAVPPSTCSLPQLHEEFTAFKSLVCSILNLLRQQITDCCKSIDVMEMRHRRKYLLISGIPEDVKDGLTDHITKLFQQKLGLQNASVNKLRVCHRLGSPIEGKCRPVLLRFSDLSLKSSVWRSKVGFKGTPFVVSEFLTQQRQALFTKARQCVGIRNCWTMDGNIHIKMKDGSRRRITDEGDLQDLSIANEASSVVEQTDRPPAVVGTSDLNSKQKRSARLKK